MLASDSCQWLLHRAEPKCKVALVGMMSEGSDAEELALNKRAEQVADEEGAFQ